MCIRDRIHTVGAGGGSIGWIDPGGSLRVGPKSAGAEPGPACYGRGGTEATVTDANVLLGRIAPRAALGGRLTLDPAPAAAALRSLGEPIGMTDTQAALGLVRVVEEVMAGAIRSVSIEQGTDPRDAWLVAFGGAGGLHATALARSLDMAGVIVPPHGGVFSAAGLLMSPPRVDLARSVHLREGHYLDGVIDRIGLEATNRLPSGDLETLADVRYHGQSHEVTVPYAVGDGDLMGLSVVAHVGKCLEVTAGQAICGFETDTVNDAVEMVSFPEVDATGKINPRRTHEQTCL